MLRMKEQIRSRWARAGSLALLGMAMAAFTGCADSKADVKGKVTYNGKTVDKGEVTVMSAKGTTHYGAIQSDGTYVIKGVPPGAAKVKVGWVDDSAIEFNKQLAAKMRENKGGGIPKDMEKPKNTIASPEKYNDYDKSGLTVDVKSPTTEFNIDLKD
ncbi:MAG TPA: carboxypeptidase-like regulatory domain-containing protein [Gemmataceae bacterium]|nr:carboxypeptidase-like regulatory domain-containing protein [Gemmataceae bacterium]